VGIAAGAQQCFREASNRADRNLDRQSIFFDQEARSRAADLAERAQGFLEFESGRDFSRLDEKERREYRELRRSQEEELRRWEAEHDLKTDAARIAENRDIRDDLETRARADLARAQADALRNQPALPPEPSEAEKVFERKAGEAAQAWQQRGRIQTADSIRKLEGVVEMIDEGKFKTGPVKNLARTALWGALGGFYKDTKAAKKAVEAVDIQSLKQTYGGSQITDSEREALFGLTFDPGEVTSVNRRRLIEKINILKKMQAAEEANSQRVLEGARLGPGQAGPAVSDEELLRQLGVPINQSNPLLPPKP